jgi:hypothetical protein
MAWCNVKHLTILWTGKSWFNQLLTKLSIVCYVSSMYIILFIHRLNAIYYIAGAFLSTVFKYSEIRYRKLYKKWHTQMGFKFFIFNDTEICAVKPAVADQCSWWEVEKCTESKLHEFEGPGELQCLWIDSRKKGSVKYWVPFLPKVFVNFQARGSEAKNSKRASYGLGSLKLVYRDINEKGLW